ncbi:BQ2448_5516 [Microbotryum intermedium]|uniref:BQ2448_5516 protein n=1 Tax=Microbotryum intermedium TaxID=269621 RepID=A0A238F4D9_9BASI|nr:BQ2448_5516 [Microbotryum intermedium]
MSAGIGLLPFSLAGTLIVLGMLTVRFKRYKNREGVAAILFVYWILLTGLQAAKISALISVQKTAKARDDKGPSKYPNSDKSLDNYVILGLYAVFTAYEVVQLLRRSPRSGDDYEQNGSPEGMGKDGY